MDDEYLGVVFSRYAPDPSPGSKTEGLNLLIPTMNIDQLASLSMTILEPLFENFIFPFCC